MTHAHPTSPCACVTPYVTVVHLPAGGLGNIFWSGVGYFNILGIQSGPTDGMALHRLLEFDDSSVQKGRERGHCCPSGAEFHSEKPG